MFSNVSLKVLSINPSYLGLFFWIVFPPLRLVQKYLGNLGLAFYLVLIFLITVFVLPNYVIPNLVKRVRKEQVNWLLGITLLIVFVIFLLINPLTTSGAYGGIGGDSDDALNKGVTQFIREGYPYQLYTYLNNPISSLPGGLLLASPFVLILGRSVYQNFLWLFLFFIFVKVLVKSGKLSIILLWILLLLCPSLLHQVVFGGDLLSNSIYFPIATHIFVSSVSGSTSRYQKLLASLFLGIVLSSRLNFLFLLPIIFTYLAKQNGIQIVLKFTMIAVLCFCGITLPFYFYNPSGFTPLIATSGHINTLPFGGKFLIPGVTLITSIVIAFKTPPRQYSTLYRNCAILLAIPIILTVILSSFQFGKLDLGGDGSGLTYYGLSFLFFGVISAWLNICRENSLHEFVSQPLPTNR